MSGLFIIAAHIKLINELLDPCPEKKGKVFSFFSVREVSWVFWRSIFHNFLFSSNHDVKKYNQADQVEFRSLRTPTYVISRVANCFTNEFME